MYTFIPSKHLLRYITRSKIDGLFPRHWIYSPERGTNIISFDILLNRKQITAGVVILFFHVSYSGTKKERKINSLFHMHIYIDVLPSLYSLIARVEEVL